MQFTMHNAKSPQRPPYYQIVTDKRMHSTNPIASPAEQFLLAVSFVTKFSASTYPAKVDEVPLDCPSPPVDLTHRKDIRTR